LGDAHDDVMEAASDALAALLGQRAGQAVKLYRAERDRRQAELRGEVTWARTHKHERAFCARWKRNVTLLRGFYSFLDVCEGSVRAKRPCENYHCLYNDVMASGFWLRNEMGITAVTSRTEAYDMIKEQGAVDYTLP
jgi:hypothetical protein